MTGILNLLLGAGGVIKDTYFNLVSLLLPGNGTNGAQNNTFLDSSTNNFTITRNGNTTQGTFSPFSQTGWGGAFNTSTTYLTVTDTANLRFGLSNFTIEAWVYRNASGATQTIASKGASTPTGWVFQISSADKLVFTDTSTSITGTTSIAANTWTYVAVVRAGTGASQTTLYVNGTSDGTGTSATNFNQTSNMLIGADRSTTNFANGYISNLRLSNTNRTISSTPTTALTADANTIFLSLNLNRFQYTDSTAAYTNISVTGTPSVVAFSPFAPTTAYTTAAVGGSGYFDGTGDYLTWGPGSGAAFGTSAFCVEMWFYPTGSIASIYLIDARNASQTSTWSFAFAYGGTSSRIEWANNGTVIANGGTTNVISNAWNHIVYCRSGTGANQASMFINGVRQDNVTDSTNYNVNPTTSYVGCRFSAEAFLTGYLSSVRIVNGSQVYDPSLSTLTVPTAPLTAITNTSTLLNFTNAGITDATAKNDLETVGNAQISTSVSKFGGGSMSFDGNNDSLNGPSSTELDMGTGNWTVEGWVNITTRTLNYPLIIGNNNGSFSAGAVAFTVSNADLVTYNDRFNLSVYDIGGTRVINATGTANATGTWYHFAVVRNGTNISIYRDGVSVASATVSASLTINWGKGGVRVGGNNWDGAQSYLNGYIDDLRVTKGYARYVEGTGGNAGKMVFNGTNTLALPTAPFPVQ